MIHPIKNTNKPQKSADKRACMAAVALSAVFICSPALSALASAPAENTPKQEVVYVNLGSDGTVSDIYVVNSFELSEAGEIIDYGDYSDLRNMTTGDELSFEDETVRINAGAGTLYYEGKLNSSTIPWDFSVRYYLDEQEISGKDLAGKSGALKITVSIRQNPDCGGAFFENYGLQLSLTLDTELCKNISAEGATAASVGKDRQLTYTVLPDNEKDFVITADVTDFEMPAIAINGLPINMDVEMDTDSNPELNEKIDDLEDAVAELDDGAGELNDGAAELRDGADELLGGTEELRDGVAELRDGTAELCNGADSLSAGANELKNGMAELQNGASSLKDGSAALSAGAQELAEGIRQSAEGAQTLRESIGGLKSGADGLYSGANDLYNGLAALDSQSGTLVQGAYSVFAQLTDQAAGQINATLTAAGMSPIALTPENYDAVLSELMNQLSGEAAQSIADLKGQLDSYNTFYLGLQQYTSGVNASASGAQELSSGASALAGGAESLSSGAGTLCDGLSSLQEGGSSLLSGASSLSGATSALCDASLKLKDGSAELQSGASELKEGAAELLDGVAELDDGSAELYDGTAELYDGTVELYDGAAELYDGTVELYDGTVELKDGTFEFRDKTANLDTELKDKINDAIKDMLGSDFDTVSFVSDKNTNVKAVQFVIQTEAVSIEEPEETEPAEEASLTFWQKLLRLFGMA